MRCPGSQTDSTASAWSGIGVRGVRGVGYRTGTDRLDDCAADGFKLSVSVPVVEEGTGRGRVSGGGNEVRRWGRREHLNLNPAPCSPGGPSIRQFAAADWTCMLTNRAMRACREQPVIKPITGPGETG